MSATVGAAIKKVAVALLKNPKVLKTVGGIVLGIIIIIIMPIIAVIAIFNGDISIDTDRLHQMVVENLSAEDKANLQLVEDTMNGIEKAMKDAGFTSRVKEAQVLYTLVLSDKAHEQGFITRLVGCFSANQTDGQLIAAVNAAFGTELSAADFTELMGNIRAVAIDVSGYTDPATKNNLDLVRWAVAAEKARWGYVYGTFGGVLDKSLLEYKLEQYPSEVGNYEEFIRENWLGRRTADCVGLIKGYGWLDTDTLEVKYGTNGMPDVDAGGMYAAATEKGTIDTIPEIPGLAVWHYGHIGIYIGNGEVIQAADTRSGVIRTQLADNRWTHWLKIPYISYSQEAEENLSG